MTDTSAPPLGTLPSRRELNRATLIAAAVAALLLLIAVLPGEYGVDPTGIGRLLGLTRMGEVKQAQNSDVGAVLAPAGATEVTTTADGGTQVRIVIRPYGGREVKASMQAGQAFDYQWSTDGAPIEFELHGETFDAKEGEFTDYQKGTAANGQGNFKAPFAGRHGWYWHNTTNKPVTVTVTAKGQFQKFEPIGPSGEAVATVAPTTSSADAARYDTQMALGIFMKQVMQHAGDGIWKRQGYTSDATGSHSNFPKNAAEWKDAENASLLLAQMTNVLLIPGRRVEEQGWEDAAKGVHRVALEAAAAARKQDEDAFFEAGGKLDEACDACHMKYDPSFAK